MVSDLAGKCILPICILRLDDSVNPFLHTVHLNGFFSAWTTICLLRLDDRVNPFSHTEHLNGFFPVWILTCSMRLLDHANPLPHTKHLNGLCPVWTTICSRSLCKVGNSLSHNEQPNCFFSGVVHHMYLNPLRAKFFRVNLNIYLHFMSFLHTNKTHAIEIPHRVRQGPAYST